MSQVSFYFSTAPSNYIDFAATVKLAIREGLEPPFATPITIREVEAPLGYRT